jgi:hypothetical protein
LQADRLDLSAQAFHRVAMDACQQVALTPLQVPCPWAEVATQHIAFGFQAGQRLLDLHDRFTQRRRNLCHAQRAVAAQASA